MIFNSLKIFNGSILSRSSIVWRDKKSKSILNIFTLYFSEIYIHLINLHKNGLTFSLVKFWNKCLQKLIDHFHFVLFWNIFTDYTHCWEKYRKGKASSNKNSQCLRVFWNGDINYLFRCGNDSSAQSPALSLLTLCVVCLKKHIIIKIWLFPSFVTYFWNLLQRIFRRKFQEH